MARIDWWLYSILQCAATAIGCVVLAFLSESNGEMAAWVIAACGWAVGSAGACMARWATSSIHECADRSRELLDSMRRLREME